jgi:hydrogenase-4 component B
VACGFIGLLPVVVVGPALRAGAAVAGVPDAGTLGGVGDVMASVRWIAWSAAALVVTLGAGWMLRAAVLRRRPVRSGPTWGCGYALTSARMQYTASSFAAPLLEAYGPLAGVEAERGPATFATHAHDPVLDGVLERAWGGLQALAARLRPLERGRLSNGLFYVLTTVIVLLAYLVVAARAL